MKQNHQTKIKFDAIEKLHYYRSWLWKVLSIYHLSLEFESITIREDIQHWSCLKYRQNNIDGEMHSSADT
jgi:hypothetical protein